MPYSEANLFLYTHYFKYINNKFVSFPFNLRPWKLFGRFGYGDLVMASLFWGCLFCNYYRIVTVKLGNLIISICGVFHIRYIFNFFSASVY